MAGFIRSSVAILIVVFLCDTIAMPAFVHHAQLALLEECAEAFESLEETLINSRAKARHQLRPDGHNHRYIRTYQDPTLDTLKQPPRISV